MISQMHRGNSAISHPAREWRRFTLSFLMGPWGSWQPTCGRTASKAPGSQYWSALPLLRCLRRVQTASILRRPLEMELRAVQHREQRDLPVSSTRVHISILMSSEDVTRQMLGQAATRR